MLIRAAEAREKVESKVSKETEAQLLAAEKSIKEAINKGQTSCYCYKYLSEQTISKLSELEYKVQNNSSQKDGSSFEISW